jgi:hypothetical protein
MTLRSRRGEAVMLAVMGIMMVGGMLLWMFSGHSPMSGMHGGKHPASEVRSGEHHGGVHDVHDAPEGHLGGKREDEPVRDRPRTPGGDERILSANPYQPSNS